MSVESIRRTIKKYGEEACRNAYVSHQQGNGASTVGIEFGIRTNTADALISAGEFLAWNDKLTARIDQEIVRPMGIHWNT